MINTILDCYTDEPAGLGVPPYLGTYPRYIAGYLDIIPYYITIDDLRLYHKLGGSKGLGKLPKHPQKTNIKTYNLTKNFENIHHILERTNKLIEEAC